MRALVQHLCKGLLYLHQSDHYRQVDYLEANFYSDS